MTRKKRTRLSTQKIRRFLTNPKFEKAYLIVSVVLLGLSTIIWSWLGSIIQSGNADQLANSYLFESPATASGAILPDQHSFLLKIPILWAVNLFGGSPLAFSIVTTLLVLTTVGLFAYFLYKIEKRPLIIGTLFIALALVLTMIPAEPYSGSLLPTNMAMLTTRNIEYIFFLLSIAFVIKAPRLMGKYVLVAIILSTLLIASDKLFMTLGVGGAAGLLVVALFSRNAPVRSVAIRWLIVAVASTLAALVLLRLLNLSGILTTEGTGVAGPYGFVHTFKDLILGVIYGVLGIFTNFGANPGYDSRTVVDLPMLAAQRVTPITGFVYTMCFAIVVTVIALSTRIVRRLLAGRKRKSRVNKPFSKAEILSLAMISVSLVAGLIYIVTNHYYPVDARYLAVVLFAGFVVLAGTRLKRPLPLHLFVVGILLTVSLVVSMFIVAKTFTEQQVASSDVRNRTTHIAEALKHHHVETLIGDYWRVLPVKAALNGSQQVTPLSDCATNRNLLTSTAWNVDNTKSFAYLLNLEGPSATFPSCSIKNVTDQYGRPDSSLIIRGGPKDPKELLLFYDTGVHKTNRVNVQQLPPDTVVPIQLSSLPFTACVKQTVMQFVAHEDDDLLFMSPDLNNEIKQGNCIRTIYFTAGDAGRDRLYWLERQRGAEAAYDSLLKLPLNTPWTERVVEISPGHFATIATPRSIHQVSLIFLHLPDGGVEGRGFFSSQDQSLEKLLTGRIGTIQGIDGGSTYTNDELKNALAMLLQTYHPDQVRVQSTKGGGRFRDHSDHTAVGNFTTQALKLYSGSPTITYYLGYPVHELPENVFGADYTAKVDAFLTFGQFDSATCTSLEMCNNHSVYGVYLRRQYTSPY
ncbi:MAG: hypothetical protein JWM52_526 [Candidatus Saccharibacteria bacterium]|nr:hypothetical protein [Candidatus Saccharibacteria bacterium]